jgi:hypothetical protein
MTPTFSSISQRAATGVMSRQDFPIAILREEFKVYPKMRNLLKNLKIAKIEVSKSEEYKKIMDCPINFDDFISYMNSMNSTNRDVIQMYQMQYDALRQSVSHSAK